MKIRSSSPSFCASYS